MMTAKSKRKRFADTLTDEQRELLHQSYEQAERERPEIVAEARRYAAETAAIREEMLRAFEMLKGQRHVQKISLAEMAARTGMTKRSLQTLEQADRPGVTLLILSRYARALGKELRILIGETIPAHARRRTKATVV